MSVENAKSQSTQNSDSSSVSYPNTRREMSNIFNNPNKSVATKFKPLRIDELLAEFFDDQDNSPTREKVKIQRSHDEDNDSLSENDDINGDDILDRTIMEESSSLDDTSGINIIQSSHDDSTDCAVTAVPKSRIKISDKKSYNDDVMENGEDMKINMNDIFKPSKPRKTNSYHSSKQYHLNETHKSEFQNPFSFISDRKNSDTGKKPTESNYMSSKKEVPVSPTKSQVSSKLYSTQKKESVLTEKDINILDKEHVKSKYNLDSELKNSTENQIKRNIQFSLPMNHHGVTPIRKSTETPMRAMSKVYETPTRPMGKVSDQMQSMSKVTEMQSVSRQTSMRSMQKVSDTPMRSTSNTRSMPKILEMPMRSMPKVADTIIPRVQETPMRVMKKASETPMRSMPKSTETPLRMQHRPYETPMRSQSRPAAPIQTPRSLETPVAKLSGLSKSDSNFKTIRVKGIDFIVITKLGEGGSCQVFDCLDPETLEHRAIKIVNLAVDAVTANGYINEVKMLRSLQGNEYVVKMFDYEITKQTLFVILEKGGIDLSVFLRNIAVKSARLPIHVINYYWMEMLNCVREIHDAGIIHSDLKPSNFLIVDGRLKLIDFGIASRLSSDKTSVIKNVQVGTFNYISPEALSDSRGSESPGDGRPRIKISFKSDVWSLGCILYQLVYRKTPFHNIGNTYAKLIMIADSNHTIEYPKADGIPSKTIEIIKKCLQYEIKKRPTVIELISFYNTAIC